MLSHPFGIKAAKTKCYSNKNQGGNARQCFNWCNTIPFSASLANDVSDHFNQKCPKTFLSLYCILNINYNNGLFLTCCHYPTDKLKLLRRDDNQHNDTQHNDIQHNDNQHNDNQHNDNQHNPNQHNDNQHNDNQLNDIH
jgi:hypothetical protein